MKRVYARKTIGWVGHGEYYTFALAAGSLGWFYEKGTGTPPASIQAMAAKWPTEGPALVLAVHEGAVQLPTGDTLQDWILKPEAANA